MPDCADVQTYVRVESYAELDALPPGTLCLGCLGRIMLNDDAGKWRTIGIRSTITPILPVWVIPIPLGYAAAAA